MRTPTKYRCVGCRPVAGQSRFVAVKRTALDGLVWWCIYDQREKKYYPGYRYRLRKDCELQITHLLYSRMDSFGGWLPFEPDNEQQEKRQ